jgi:hypothetical protein
MEEQSLPLLPLENLAARHYGLIEPIAGGYLAAARVCLDRHHQSPVNIRIKNATEEKRATVEWERADDRTSGALNNETDTTEAGAYACIIAAVELSESMFAVRRAETGTGADYYVAPAGKPMRTEAAEAGFYTSPNGKKYRRIQLLTVEQLFEGKIVDYPFENVTYRKGERELPPKAENLEIEF